MVGSEVDTGWRKNFFLAFSPCQLDKWWLWTGGNLSCDVAWLKLNLSNPSHFLKSNDPLERVSCMESWPYCVDYVACVYVCIYEVSIRSFVSIPDFHFDYPTSGERTASCLPCGIVFFSYDLHEKYMWVVDPVFPGVGLNWRSDTITWKPRLFSSLVSGTRDGREGP